MDVTKLEPFPPNTNPFLYDAYNMGHRVGTNFMVMYDKHPTQRAEYMIIVNIETGERLQISLP